MNKKFLKFITSLFIVSLSSCSNNQISSTAPSHTHKFNDGELVIDNENYLEKMVYECECGEIIEEISHQHTFDESYSYTEKTHYKNSNCGHPILAYIENHTFGETGKCLKCDYVDQKIYEEYAKYNLPIEIKEHYSWLTTLDKNSVMEIQIEKDGVLNYSSNKETISKLYDAVYVAKFYPLEKEKQDSDSINLKSTKINFLTDSEGYSLSLCDNTDIVKINDVYYTSDFDYELDNTYMQGNFLYSSNNVFRYNFNKGSIFANDVYKEKIQTSLYNYIVVNKLEQVTTLYNKKNLTIKTNVGRILTIIDPTHIMIDKQNIYEIIGSVNFKDIYDQYYVETESATLTIIDSLNSKTKAKIIYDKGVKIEKLTMVDLGFDYESFLTNRYLYEDELLTNKLTSLTMDEDKTVYLGLIEIGEFKFKEIIYENYNQLLHGFAMTSAEGWYTTYTYSDGGSTPIIPTGTLLTSYEDLLNTKFAYAADVVFKKEIFNDYNIIILYRTASASNFTSRLYSNLVVNENNVSIDYISPYQLGNGLSAIYYCYDFILIPKDITYNLENIETIKYNNLADIFS